MADALPIELDFAKDKSASPERMNRAMAYLNAQARQILALKPDYEAAVEELKGIGLDRINAVLAPVFALAQEQAEGLQAIYDDWVSGNALDDLHSTIGGETSDAIAVLANGRVAALEQRAAAAAGDRWFTNHGLG